MFKDKNAYKDFEASLASSGVALRYFEITDSTSNEAKKYALNSGERCATLFLANEQSGGRGRLGRSFLSRRGQGLYMSLLCFTDRSLADIVSVTTSAAVAVALSVEEVTGREMKIKWVNDVYLGEKKICGILTEASLCPDGRGFLYAIIGVGINLVPPKDGFPQEIRSVAGTLFLDSCPDRNGLLAEILTNFHSLYQALPHHGFMDEYRSRSCLVGHAVRVIAGDETTEGVAVTVDDEGGLVVQTLTGESRVFRSGTVRFLEDPL